MLISSDLVTFNLGLGVTHIPTCNMASCSSSGMRLRSPVTGELKDSNDSLGAVIAWAINKRFQDAHALACFDDAMCQLFLSQYMAKSPSASHTPSQLSLMSLVIPREAKEGFRRKYEPLLQEAFRKLDSLQATTMRMAGEILKEYKLYIPAESPRLIDMMSW